MKKIISVFLIAVTLLSCSNDNDEITLGGSSKNLLIQLAINYPTNETYTKQYNYEDGNKLSDIVDSNGNREYYTYDGDYISKIEYKNNDPKFRNERFFTYDTSGKLIQEIFLYHFNSVGTKTIFTYPTSTTVSYQTYSGNLSTQNALSEHGTYSLDANGKILENNEISDVSAINRTLTYSYDDKNSSYSNIRDASKGFNYVLGAKNNTKTFKMVVAGTEAYKSSSKFEYNKNGFPDIEYKEDAAGTTNIYFTYN